MTLFGIAYAVINTVSFNGFIYNEVTVESPIEGISAGISVIFLIIAYVILGRVDSILSLLTPLRIIGIIVILTGIISLSIIRNNEARNEVDSPTDRKSAWKHIGLGTLIFPVMYAVIDELETVATGICLDTTYGFSMPEGDSIIIIGMEYAVFALGCHIYIYYKERKIYNPFKKENAPRILGALTDNVGIVFYSYAMAIDSVSTDPILAVYPVFIMTYCRFMNKSLKLLLHPDRRTTAVHITRKRQKVFLFYHGNSFLSACLCRLLKIKLFLYGHHEHVICA